MKRYGEPVYHVPHVVGEKGVGASRQEGAPREGCAARRVGRQRTQHQFKIVGENAVMDNDNANTPGSLNDPFYIFHNFAYAVFYSLLSVDRRCSLRRIPFSWEAEELKSSILVEKAW